jgi:hypothetical protein
MKGRRPRASEVRKIEITPELNAYYLALFAIVQEKTARKMLMCVSVNGEASA